MSVNNVTWVADGSVVWNCAGPAVVGATVTTSVDIANISFQHCSPAIKTSGNSTELTLRNVTFANNAGRGAMHIGGGGVVFHVAVVFFNNTATSVPASNEGGAMTITNGNVSFMCSVLLAHCSSNGSGGALVVTSGSVSFLAEGTFTSNRAGLSGGALYINGSASVMFGGPSMFFNNSADIGGALWVGDGGTVEYLANSTFTANSASTGGAISADQGTVTFLEAATLEGNVAEVGGGLWQQYGTVRFLGMTTIRNNTALGYGGGVLLTNGTLLASAQTLLYGNRAMHGAAVAILSGSVLFESASESVQQNLLAMSAGPALVRIACNTAQGNGGALIIEGGSVVFDSGVLFLSNTAAAYGGCLFAVGGSISFTSTSVLDSNQASMAGGAVYISGSANLKFNSSVVSNNTAQNGGALYVDGGRIAFQDPVQFDSNTALSGEGGAAFIFLGAVDTYGATVFNRNSAAQGGAVAIYGGTSSHYSSTMFLSNHASAQGGSLYVNGGTVTFLANALFNTSSARYGGALAVSSGACLFHESVMFRENQAGAGGAMYFTGGLMETVSSVEFFNNSALVEGGGALYSFSGNLSFGAVVSFSMNSAPIGGALFGSNVINFVSGVEFFQNRASVCGGGAFLWNGTLSFFSAVAFSNNAAPNGSCMASNDSVVAFASDASFMSNTGASLLVLASTISFLGKLNVSSNYMTPMVITSGTVAIKGPTRFYNNSGLFGGAIRSVGGVLDVTGNSTFLENFSFNDGGTIYVAGGTIRISSVSTWTRNSAAGCGGAIMVSSGTVDLSGTETFTLNHAFSGGGICATGGSLSLNGTQSFSVNSADASGYGGAMFISNDAQILSFAHLSFSSNTATNGFGGAIALEKNGSLNSFGSAVFRGNIAGTGSSVWASSGYLSATHWTFSSCTGQNGSAVALFQDAYFALTNMSMAGCDGAFYSDTVDSTLILEAAIVVVYDDHTPLFLGSSPGWSPGTRAIQVEVLNSNCSVILPGPLPPDTSCGCVPGCSGVMCSSCCSPGTFFDGSNCTSCTPGTSSPGGSVLQCSACPVDTYNNISRSSFCTFCPADQFSDGTGGVACKQPPVPIILDSLWVVCSVPFNMSLQGPSTLASGFCDILLTTGSLLVRGLLSCLNKSTVYSCQELMCSFEPFDFTGIANIAITNGDVGTLILPQTIMFVNSMIFNVSAPTVVSANGGQLVTTTVSWPVFTSGLSSTSDELPVAAVLFSVNSTLISASCVVLSNTMNSRGGVERFSFILRPMRYWSILGWFQWAPLRALPAFTVPGCDGINVL
eukprot:ANDGO_04659.mRNA.1 hypothetical protein SPRG_14083